MTRDPETTRIVRSWLDEGVTQLPDRVLDAVLDELPATPQSRATWWPARRTSTMNAIVKFGLAAAVLAVAALIGINYFGGTSGVGGPAPDSSTPTAEPTATPNATASPAASSSAWAGIPEGPFVVTGTDVPVQVTVDIASPGWQPLAAFDAVTKDDDGLDPPETVGGALLVWAFPAGTGFDVYGDPCQWSTTIPDSPATTPDEIATALAAQALTEATTPVDVTVGGYAGKALSLQVPMTFDMPNSTREERFADCDEAVFGFYGLSGDKSGPARNAQGAGQVDDLVILDVDGAIVIFDATYGPAAPADLVDELRALIESATLEAP